MTTPNDPCATTQPNLPAMGCGLEDVLSTEQLATRPSRTPDYEAENKALTAIAEAMSGPPERVLQKLVDVTRELTGADAAGVSVVEYEGGKEIFRWRATTGTFRPFVGGTMPRDFSPCGAVLARNATQLMAEPVRFYPYIAGLKLPIAEVLLVPFHRDDKPIGTVWAVAQTAAKRFDAEDARLITNLSKFASVAVQAMANFAAITEAKQALADARRRSASALIAGEVGTFEWDIVADRLYGDHNFERIFDIPLDQTGAAPLSAFAGAIHPDDRDRVIALVNRSVETGCPYEAEYRIANRASERWVIARGRIERDAAGRATRFPGVVLDITSEKRAEHDRQTISDEFQRQSRMYDTILSATEDFAYIFDRQGRFLFANRRLLEVWDKSLDQVVGKTCLELGYPEWHAEMHMREIRQVIETNRPIRGEVPFTGDSGISGVYDYIFTPVLGPDGEVEVIAGTTRDVTDRKRAEEERERLVRDLGHERSRLAAIIERAPAFMCTIRGPDLIFEVANEKYYEIVGRRDIIGRTVRAAIPELEGQGFIEILDNVYRTGETFAGNELPVLLQRHAGGPLERRYINLLYQAMREPDGSISGIFVHGVDVTDLVESRNEAESASRAKDRFLAVLSHELRTPLSPVLMTASAMESDPELPARFRDDVLTIRRNVELEAKLIDDLLDLSRITSGKLRLKAESVSVHTLLRHVLEVCATDLLAKRLPITFDLRATDDRVIGDPARLQQVFWNLLKNAVKFSPEGAPIVLRSFDVPGGRLRVEVTDAGMGISADVLPRVFDAFEQGDPNVTRQFGGLGLGLAISKGIVELHGGTISAASEGAGRGATFVVELGPVGIGPAGDASDSPDATRVAANRALRILLVEDHPDTARVLGRLLARSGSTVETAHTVADALRIGRAQSFDLLISDIGLPDGTGLDVICGLRQSGLRAIALSGFGMEEDARKSRDAGFAEHLTKPVNLADLGAAIDRVMSP